MGDLNVIDRFTLTFTQAIDHGFGLIDGNVTSLTAILVTLDMTLVGLFWAMDADGAIMGRLVRKVLYVGAFAFILDNFQRLAGIVFDSFASLGLQAAGSGVTAQTLLQPGHLAGVGYQAAWPLLKQASSLIGFTSVFDHFVTVCVLLFAWFVVILAFFVLAVQLFVTLIEFKLTTLAGFVLVPFALWIKSAFLAERVLGNVISSGIKVMVLALIVGIGSTLFANFTTALQGQPPSLADAMSLVLASIALFGLGVFGPGIAAGLVAGAPQLGAGAAIGAIGGVAAASFVAGGAALGVARLGAAGGLAAIRAGTSLGSGTAAAYQLGRATSGAEGLAGVGAGLAGVARTGAGLATRSARSAGSRIFADSVETGREGAWRGSGGRPMHAHGGRDDSQPSGAPSWARRMRAEQRRRAHLFTAMQTIKEGDRPASGANPDLSEGE